MKNSILFLLCLVCGVVHAQRKPKIKGNKSVIEVSENLEPYHKLQIDDDLEIRLEKSSEPGYTLTADDNLVDILKFEVADSTLFISSFYKITGKKELEITVRFDELRAIAVNEGKIMADEIISTDEMKLSIKDFAQADLKLNAEFTEVIMDGNSKAQLNVESDSLYVSMKDKSEAAIYAVSNSQLMELQNDALANLEGITDTINVKMTESSKLKAQSMQAETVRINLSGTSVARLTANNSLHLSSSGSAKLYLFGEPFIEIKEFIDNSELYKRSQ